MMIKTETKIDKLKSIKLMPYFAGSIVSLICVGEKSSLAKMIIYIFLAYGLVGFLDDFIKFKFIKGELIAII